MTAARDDSPLAETLSQRELRNRSAEVLREVESGASFVITNNGRPVAKLVPVSDRQPGLRVSRPAKRRGGFTRPILTSDVSSAEVLDELREDRI